MNEITTQHYFRCHLDTGPCEVDLRRPLMHQDNNADIFRVSVWRHEDPVDFTGVTAHGFLYLAATHQTILLDGVIDGSAAYVTLSEECYSMPGYASLVIQLHRDDVRHTVLKANFIISRTGTENIFDPEHRLPSAAELIAMIDTIRDAADFASAKLDANLGAHHAGELLYVSADGTVRPLTLGAGLEIIGGVLRVTGQTDQPVQPDDAILFVDQSDGVVLFEGATFVDQGDGLVLLNGVTATDQGDGVVLMV